MSIQRTHVLATCVLLTACASDDGATGADGGAGGPDARTAAEEFCDNSLDDDSDGLVDEVCACPAPGAVQACWPGSPAQRGVGTCRDGTQICSGDQEFLGWGDCQGAVLPGEDVPGNGLDENCDGCPDTDCMECDPDEYGEACFNGEDDDCDGLDDCEDPDCGAACGGCYPDPENCTDAIDNDCDGLIDCDDPDCASEYCGCVKKCPIGSTRYCDEPVYCAWGIQACNPDGTWGACVETTDKPPGCETYYFYDPACCVAAGECCQDFPGDASIGDCPAGEWVCP